MPATPRPPTATPALRVPRARKTTQPDRTHAEQNANADAGHIGRRDPKEIEHLVPPRADRLPPPTS